VTGNLGGAFDFITKTGQTSETALARAEFGSFGYYRQQVDGGWNTEHTDGFASVDNFFIDGYRDHSRQNRQHGTANVAWRGESWVNRIAFTRVESDEQLPGALTMKQLSQNPRQAATSLNPLFDREKANWHDDIVWNRASDQFSFDGTEDHFTAGAWLGVAEIRNPRNQIFDTHYHDLGTRLTWRHDDEWFGQDNQWSVTLTPTHAWTDETVYKNLLQGRRGNPVDATAKEWTNVDLFVQDRFQILSSLHWITSLQLGYARRSVQDHLALVGESLTRDTVDFTFLNPSTGWVWEPVAKNHEIQVYGNIARSGEAPTMGDLYQSGSTQFLSQKKQNALTVEIGSRGKLGPMGWEAALYQSWLENEFLISESFPGSGTFVTRNTPHSNHRGAELGFHIEFLPQPKAGADSLKWTSTFTWNDFHLENDPLYGNHRLPGAPEFLLQHELRYQNTRGWYVAPQLTFQPDGINVDYANTLKSDAFTLLGFRAGYEGKTGPQLFVEIQNLTDERYINEVSVTGNAGGKDQRVFWPSIGRAYNAGVSWKW
jgi:iron complex outermembrane receptor protein